MEEENITKPLVKDLWTITTSLPARALFYEVCYNFFDRDGNGRSYLTNTLRDMYEAYGVRFRERKALLDGNHPLIQTDLVEISGDKEDILLTTTEQQIFLDDDFWAFGKQYSGLNRYSFAHEIKEYVHSKEHDVENPRIQIRLAAKIRQI